MLKYFLVTTMIMDFMNWCKNFEISTWVHLYMLFYLSIRFYNSCPRLPWTKRHSSLCVHWSSMLLGDGCNVRVKYNIQIVVFVAWVLFHFFTKTWWNETPKKQYFWVLWMVYHETSFITIINIMPTIELFEVSTFPILQESSFLITIKVYVLFVFYWL
jgi:hypothetical protein